jgi:nucleotide-binding universal stress UspA family protein
MSERAPLSSEKVAEATREPLIVDEILVPLDGSAFAERALPIAVHLADRLGADLCLVAAVQHDDEIAAREADLVAADVRGPRVRHSVVVADPAGAIDDLLAESQHAVVCMATHGRGRSASILGSVANEVIARSREPLLLVGPGSGELAPWAPKDAPARGVVVCVDEMPVAPSLLGEAARWATGLGEPLTVVTVAEPVPSPVTGRIARRRFGPDGDVESFLDSLGGPVRAAGVSVETRVVWDPISPAEGMRGYLREHPAALVVVGTRARHGLDRLVFGSDAAGIAHSSPSPVLVVPRPE